MSAFRGTAEPLDIIIEDDDTHCSHGCASINPPSGRQGPSPCHGGQSLPDCDYRRQIRFGTDIVDVGRVNMFGMPVYVGNTHSDHRWLFIAYALRIEEVFEKVSREIILYVRSGPVADGLDGVEKTHSPAIISLQDIDSPPSGTLSSIRNGSE